MPHGNEMKSWFFATSHYSGDSGLPHCACPHRHRTIEAALMCARKEGNSHVREVQEGVAVADHEVPCD